jgi:sugar/nucleoside kinase (ribokinase family)
MRDILGLLDIVIANEGEAAQLTLHSASVRTAIITLGARGALVMDRGTEALIDAPKVAAIDTAVPATSSSARTRGSWPKT